jgi:hypothetical protein
LNAASAFSLSSLNFQKSETILQGIQMDCALPSTSILEILSPHLARPIRESAVFWSDGWGQHTSPTRGARRGPPTLEVFSRPGTLRGASAGSLGSTFLESPGSKHGFLISNAGAVRI